MATSRILASPDAFRSENQTRAAPSNAGLSLIAPDIADGGERNFAAPEQEDNADPEPRKGEAQTLPAWTRLTSGDVVSLRAPGMPEYLATVEARTNDGEIIWIRNSQNERRLHHFSDFQSVRLLPNNSSGRSEDPLGEEEDDATARSFTKPHPR
ncbi:MULTISPECIES: hypothetical protein [unclassified Arthrobacter]|uniref:hypothetical protein n=1 Tax=unclassified Arthrobacter TaxID=235627 RepID=UPI0028830714|nr:MULTISPECIES: hypothetical protein [unclassified Arthrobacter]